MVDRLHTREICNDRATFQLLSRNLTICYLSSLHRTHNKDGTKREGELGEGGVYFICLYSLLLPLATVRLKQKLPPQLTSGDVTGDKIAYCKCLLFLCLNFELC